MIALNRGTEQGRLAEARTSHATPRKYGILVVDDEACVRDILNLGMRQRGFAVSLAANGQEALETCTAATARRSMWSCWTCACRN